MPPSAPIAYHLVPRADWGTALGTAPGTPFRPASLLTEGFVHLTHRMTDLVEVANALYRSEPGPHLVLTVRLAALSVPWRYDGDERYPHVYGPLDRAAITEVRPIPRRDDGTFAPIERPDTRRRPDIPALVARLVDGGVRFVVLGSAGAKLLGADLTPGDLDLCPDPEPGNLARLARVLAGLDARPRVVVPGWVTPEEAESWRPTPDLETLDRLLDTSLGDLDVVPAPLAPDGRARLEYATLADSAVRVTVDGRTVRVAAPALLAGSKLAGRRPKDERAREELERLL